MLNPWTFGLEAVQQGWQAQSALAFSLMRSFAGGVPKQTTSSPLIPDTVPDAIKARKRLSQLAMCERRLPQPSTGKRRLPRLPMRDVAKPRRFCGPPRRHLA
jgi:hypothetical protein